MKIATFLFIGLFGIAHSLFAQTVIPENLVRQAENLSGDTFRVFTKTQKGVTIYALRKPGKQMLKAIDKGFNDLFTIAKKNGYYSYLKPSNYIIFIVHPDRLIDSNGNYVPNFAIPVGQYAGTDYDQGGFMYAAGMVIGYNPGAFIIAETAKNFEQVSEIVRFEGEHIVLYHNDRQRYNETADHSKGGGHPILH